MGMFEWLFKASKTTKPDEMFKPIEAVNSNDAGDYKGTISKRAAALGIPQPTIDSNLQNLSSHDLELLAGCADNLLMVYLFSPFGTKAKAETAKKIGLSS